MTAERPLLIRLVSIIAIMLGRLRMSVDECIVAYQDLSTTVFRKTAISPVKVNGKIKSRFDTDSLEKAMKKTVRDRLEKQGEAALLMEDQCGGQTCRV